MPIPRVDSAATQPGRLLRRLEGINETLALVGNFDDFARDARPRLVALAYSLLGDRGAAEDSAQDALLAVHRRWDTISEPLAYARRTVANVSASNIRRLGRERRALARVAARPEPFAELDAPDAEFWRAVAALPDRQRQVIALHYVEDLPVVDIAALLEIAPGTVKSTLSDARRSLAATLTLSLDDEEAS